MTYTIRLVTLRCDLVQEENGDEIYLLMNGHEIFNWAKINKRYHDLLKDGRFMTTFDFRTASYNTPDGWQAVEAYTPDDFVFSGLEGVTELALWESDKGEFLRGADDLLGTLAIQPEEAEHDVESVHLFKENGARYELTYVVVKD